MKSIVRKIRNIRRYNFPSGTCGWLGEVTIRRQRVYVASATREAGSWFTVDWKVGAA